MPRKVAFPSQGSRISSQNSGKHTNVTLREVLFSPHFKPGTLDPTYKPDLNLLRGCHFDDLLQTASTEQDRAEIMRRYEERMAPLIREYYDLVCAGQESRFSGFWNGKKNIIHVRVLTRYILEDKIGLEIDEETRTIDQRLFRSNQRQFLRDQGAGTWSNLFAKYKLKGMLLRALESQNSIIEIFQKTYPWIFDYDAPEGQHLHLNDFAKFPKLGKRQEREARIAELRHILEMHIGLKMDEQNNHIDPRLFPSNQKKFLESFGVSRWIDLLVKLGAAGLARGPFKDSFYLAFRAAYPWAFDLTTPAGKHLHSWDFSPQGIWQNKETRVMATKHLFEKDLGLTVSPERISARLLTPEGIKGILEAEGVTGWGELFEKHGLVCLLYSYTGESKIHGQVVEALKEAYPFAFDLKSEEGQHLHFWMFLTQEIWKGKTANENAKKATIHVFEKHLGILDEGQRTFNVRLHPRNHSRFFSDKKAKNWADLFNKYGLSGMFGELFNSSPKKLLEKIFPWLFDLETEEGKHLHLWEFASPQKWTDEASNKLIRTGINHVAVRHLALPLEREPLRKSLTRRVLVEHGFSKRMLRERFGFSLLAVFRLAFPKLFPRGEAYQDWLERLRSGPIKWGKVPTKVQRWFVDLLALELDKDVDLLTTRDFQRKVAIFGGKNLFGLLRYYRRLDMPRHYWRPGVSDTDALKNLKMNLRISDQDRDFYDWLKNFQKRHIRWELVPLKAQAQFVLYLAHLRKKHFLSLSTSDFWSKQDDFAGKTLGGLLSHYTRKNENPGQGLIRIMRLLLNLKREDLTIIREDEMLQQGFLEKGQDRFSSMNPQTRERFIKAYFDPQYFEPQEIIQNRLHLSLAIKHGTNPITSAGNEHARDIRECLVMLGLVA